VSDPNLERFRAEITEIDRLIFDALARRVELVAALRRYKDEHGIAFLDPGREERMVEEQVEASRGGVLSEDGVRSFYRALLDFVKREL
jgi:chorismate mutase